jgi:enoyl-[acyl-carrier protein] reductase I
MSMLHSVSGDATKSIARPTLGIMAGKRGLVMGVANHRSLAWGIASRLREHGADLAYSYYGQGIKDRLVALLVDDPTAPLYECDVSREESISSMIEKMRSTWAPEIDFIVHSVAYAPKQELRGRFIDTSAAAFHQSMNVSCYSLTLVSRLAAPLMKEGGSILTLTFLGSRRVIPNYNVMGVAKAALEASVHYLAVDLGAMGIRINAISAGPVKTLSASGVGDFHHVLKWCAANSPLRRNITIGDVGGAGIFLLSDLARGVTGETIHVDGGYHLIGMKIVDAIPIDTSSVAPEYRIADGAVMSGLSQGTRDDARTATPASHSLLP